MSERKFVGICGSLRKNFRPRPIELDTVLIDFVDSMTPVAEKKGIFLEICLPEETIPAVSADEDRVKQILSILVDNALRYAPEKSTVHTSLEKQSKGCVPIRCKSQDYFVNFDPIDAFQRRAVDIRRLLRYNCGIKKGGQKND